jgi:hypothetical protein
MAADTSTPTETKPTAPAAGITVAAEPKAPPKPAARPRAAKPVAPAAPKPARKPAAAKASSTSTKAVTRPTPRKLPPAEAVTHEPKPFIAKNRKAGKPAKVKKAKLVRNSFTMPDAEYEQIAALKKRCLDAGVPAKKRDILRAAVANLAKLSDSSLVATVRRLEAIKTGRPAKAKRSK